MTVKSYLAFPTEGRKQELVAGLAAIEGCDVLPADNREVAVLVTEASSSQQEKELLAKVEALPSLACLSLVYGALNATPSTEGEFSQRRSHESHD